MIYVPDAFGRVANGVSSGRWIEDPNADPFGHRYRTDLAEEEFDFSAPFNPSGSIGDRGKNDRNDVANLEGLLRLTGDMDLSRTDGPTGYYGSRLDEGIRRFQTRRGLTVDGVVNPGGQTIRALKTELARLARSPSARSDLSPSESGYLNQITGWGSQGIPRRPPGIRDHLHRPSDGDPRDHARILPAYLDDEPAFINYGSSRRTLSAAASDGSDDQGEKKGKYIWRTQGDGKVRPEHAERDDEEFDWDNPPPGGHPGEAPNCRCWPENIGDSAACKEAKDDVHNAKNALESAQNNEKTMKQGYDDAKEKLKEAEAHYAEVLSNMGVKGSLSLDGLGRKLGRRMTGFVGAALDYSDIRAAAREVDSAQYDVDFYQRELETARKEVADAQSELGQAYREQQSACGE